MSHCGRARHQPTLGDARANMQLRRDRHSLRMHSRARVHEFSDRVNEKDFARLNHCIACGTFNQVNKTETRSPKYYKSTKHHSLDR